MNKEVFLKSIGNQIRKIRVKKGFDQTKITIETGFSSGTISKIENGKVDVQVWTLRILSEALDVALTDLLQADDT